MPEVDDPGELVVGGLHAVDDLVAGGHVLQTAVLGALAMEGRPGGEALAQNDLSTFLEDLLGLHSEDGVEGVGEHVPRGERVLEERVGLPPLLARHSLTKNDYGN